MSDVFEVICLTNSKDELVEYTGDEIVRCKDCKWHTDNFCNNFNVIGFSNDDFCSLGERKDNE